MKTKKPLSVPKVAALAGYTRRRMLTLAGLPNFPGVIANPGCSHHRYHDTPHLRAWCAVMREKQMVLQKSRLLGGKPDWFFQTVRLSGRLTGVIRHRLLDRALHHWDTDTIVSMLASLEPISDITSELKAELETRPDKPKFWTPPLTRRSEQSSSNASARLQTTPRHHARRQVRGNC